MKFFFALFALIYNIVSFVVLFIPMIGISYVARGTLNFKGFAQRIFSTIPIIPLGKCNSFLKLGKSAFCMFCMHIIMFWVVCAYYVNISAHFILKHLGIVAITSRYHIMRLEGFKEEAERFKETAEEILKPDEDDACDCESCKAERDAAIANRTEH